VVDSDEEHVGTRGRALKRVGMGVQMVETVEKRVREMKSS
jgi:ActR/RegA family two-component response regulator